MFTAFPWFQPGDCQEQRKQARPSAMGVAGPASGTRTFGVQAHKVWGAACLNDFPWSLTFRQHSSRTYCEIVLLLLHGDGPARRGGFQMWGGLHLWEQEAEPSAADAFVLRGGDPQGPGEQAYRHL